MVHLQPVHCWGSRCPAWRMGHQALWQVGAGTASSPYDLQALQSLCPVAGAIMPAASAICFRMPEPVLEHRSLTWVAVQQAPSLAPPPQRVWDALPLSQPCIKYWFYRELTCHVHLPALQVHEQFASAYGAGAGTAKQWPMAF